MLRCIELLQTFAHAPPPTASVDPRTTCKSTPSLPINIVPQFTRTIPERCSALYSIPFQIDVGQLIVVQPSNPLQSIGGSADGVRSSTDRMLRCNAEHIRSEQTGDHLSPRLPQRQKRKRRGSLFARAIAQSARPSPWSSHLAEIGCCGAWIPSTHAVLPAAAPPLISGLILKIQKDIGTDLLLYLQWNTIIKVGQSLYQFWRHFHNGEYPCRLRTLQVSGSRDREIYLYRRTTAYPEAESGTSSRKCVCQRDKNCFCCLYGQPPVARYRDCSHPVFRRSEEKDRCLKLGKLFKPVERDVPDHILECGNPTLS